MTRYAAFLRGVNVGGVNLKMADVATALGDAGFDNVRTILASGNVVLDATGSAASVRKKAEAALREAFGYDAWVLVYPLETVRAIADGYPFEAEVEGHHSYVTFVSDPAVLDELAALSDRGRPAGEDRPRRRGALLAGAQVGHAWSRRSARRWARSATSPPPPPAICARWSKCCAECGPRVALLAGQVRQDRRQRAGRGLRDRAADPQRPRLSGRPARRDPARPDGHRAGRKDRLRFRQVRPQGPGDGAAITRRRPVCRSTTSRTHPKATVVALAEGFQTSFWRLDDALPGRAVPVGVDRSAARDRAAAAAAAVLPADHQPRAVRAGLQLDGPGRHRRRCLHHRRGTVDVPAARRGDGADHPVRQAVSRRPDVLRPAAGDWSRSSPRRGCGHPSTTGCRRCRSACR